MPAIALPSAPDPAEVADALDAAADYMIEHGHHRDSLYNPATGAVCHNGAIFGALGGLYQDAEDGYWASRQMDAAKMAVFYGALRATANYLGFAPKIALASPVLPQWSDRSDTAEVVQTMRDAAAKVRPDATDGGQL